MNKAIRNFRIGFAAFGCFFSIFIFFVSSSILTNWLGNFLHIHPSYTGGEIEDSVFDTAGDDFGNENLIYPENKIFAEGSMDLIRYTVHTPVLNAQWQNYTEYWQLVLEYKNGPANIRNIMIYIDLDNIEGGSTESLFEGAENVTFNKNHPWDFAIWISNGGGKVYDSNKNKLCNTEYYELNDGKSIKINIPLQNEKLQSIFGAKKTYHYVITGGYSEFDNGGFMPIENKSSYSRGSTKLMQDYNQLIPKIYDVLGDNNQLGNWNIDNNTKAQLIPVEVEMHNYAVTGKVWHGKKDDNNDDYIQKVCSEYTKYASSSNKYFENLEKSSAELKKLIEKNPNDCVSLSYYGSITAMLGGQSNVIKAMALVNQAFEYLDKAVELSRNTENEIEVLANRASVAYSVPNEVFEKMEVAAGDFIRITEIYKSTYSKEELCKPEISVPLAYYYVMAGQSYKKLGNETEYVLALQEAKKLIE